MLMLLTPLRTSSKKLTRLIASRTPTFTQHAAHQANQTRTLICDGFWKEGITRNASRFLHHSCASLLHWRGLRSVAKRRYGALKKSAARPWLPEEEQVEELYCFIFKEVVNKWKFLMALYCRTFFYPTFFLLQLNLTYMQGCTTCGSLAAGL